MCLRTLWKDVLAALPNLVNRVRHTMSDAQTNTEGRWGLLALFAGVILVVALQFKDGMNRAKRVKAKKAKRDRNE